MATETTVPTTHRRLLEWVDEAVTLCEPEDVHWCDGSGRGVRPAVPSARRSRHVRAALGRQAPQLLSRAVGPRGRRARREPHVHLLEVRGGCRPDQQLARPRRDARAAAREVHRLHARPHPVRGSVLDGPARLADLRDRRAADRLGLRRRLDADHDPHGAARTRLPRREMATSSRACTPPARRWARARRAVHGRATRTSTSSTTPRRARSGPTARATAATRCWARSASRCGSHR